MCYTSHKLSSFNIYLTKRRFCWSHITRWSSLVYRIVLNCCDIWRFSGVWISWTCFLSHNFEVVMSAMGWFIHIKFILTLFSIWIIFHCIPLRQNFIVIVGISPSFLIVFWNTVILKGIIIVSHYFFLHLLSFLF